jgi:hypothetical protein
MFKTVSLDSVDYVIRPVAKFTLSNHPQAISQLWLFAGLICLGAVAAFIKNGTPKLKFN